MGLGEITRQIAGEAIRSSTKDMLDALRPPDLGGIAEAITGVKPNQPPGQTDNTGATILGQIQAMQKALKEDEELVVLCSAGVETLRVLDLFLHPGESRCSRASTPGKVVTRVVCPVEQLVLTCKVMKAPAGRSPRDPPIAPKAQ